MAEGSLGRFMKEKFYKSCTRVHQILAAMMEHALVYKYLEVVNDEDESLAWEVMSD